MKKIGKSIVDRALALLARLGIKRFKPEIIGITGSMGKTTTKEAVAHILERKHKVLASRGSYNTEIGLPLSIFNEVVPVPKRSIFKWTAILLSMVYKIIFGKYKGYKFILEMGADKPGDISYLIGLAPPNIAIVTAVAPVHTLVFKEVREVAQEKGKIVAALPKDGLAILNGDDPRVVTMRELTKANVINFGFNEGCDVRGVDPQLNETGMKFDLTYDNQSVSIQTRILGRHMLYPVLAASAVAIHYGFTLTQIANNFTNFISPRGRMRSIDGINNSLIIDDSYNSNPQAAIAALDLTEKIVGGRKIVVLGSMNELGSYEEEGHRLVGKKAAEFADVLVTVGYAAEKYMVDEARKNGMQNIFSFENSTDAGKFLKTLIKENDVVLVKGSQNKIRMERAIKYIMKNPELAHEQLVRQGKIWEGEN